MKETRHSSDTDTKHSTSVIKAIVYIFNKLNDRFNIIRRKIGKELI